MQQSSTTRFLPLDGLRGVAVLTVLGYHTANIPAAGRVGVDLFFVLSGYLITKILIAEKTRTGSVDLVEFYWRRVIRLYPALLLACAFFVCLTSLKTDLDERPLASVFASLLMIANYTRALDLNFPTALGHTWSLAVEWQFYLLWPPLFLIIRAYSPRRRYLLTFLILGVVGVWWSRYSHAGTVWLWSALDTRADGLLYGAIIAVVLSWRGSLRLPTPLLAAAVAAMTWVAFRKVPGELYLSNLLSALIVFGVVQNSLPAFNRVLSVRPLVYVGQVSYGLYLYHFPIAALLYVEGYPPTLNLAVTGAVSIGMAALSWHFIEQPLLTSTGRVRADVRA